jgi:hypothetical protein
MMLPKAVASQAGKIRVEVVTRTLFALQRVIHVVFVGRMFAPNLFLTLLAWGFPFRNIEVFSPHQPVHAALFRPRRDEFELFAGAVFILAVCAELLAEVLVFVVF